MVLFLSHSLSLCLSAAVESKCHCSRLWACILLKLGSWHTKLIALGRKILQEMIGLLCESRWYRCISNKEKFNTDRNSVASCEIRLNGLELAGHLMRNDEENPTPNLPSMVSNIWDLSLLVWLRMSENNKFVGKNELIDLNTILRYLKISITVGKDWTPIVGYAIQWNPLPLAGRLVGRPRKTAQFNRVAESTSVSSFSLKFG